MSKRSDLRALRAAAFGSVVATMLLSPSPLFLGDLSWLGIEVRSYGRELNNPGS
ncbi:MAG TPA: hypothetical protein PLW14_04990 [Chlorobiota bacterium]|mgnify:CR=1 FL=1|nr:hypothetical protein [Chlorobiota bacterium]